MKKLIVRLVRNTTARTGDERVEHHRQARDMREASHVGRQVTVVSKNSSRR